MPTTRSPVPFVGPGAQHDLPALHDLARRTIDASYRPFLGDEAVDWFIGSGGSDQHITDHLAHGHVRVLHVGHDVVGLTILDGDLLDLIMVDVSRHGQGLGRVLLADAEAQLHQEHPVARLESFEGNTAALGFYLAHGWQETSRTPAAGGMPARITLTKSRPA
ncbi:GNAT family N-acetyltransferase [Micromonospora musae]|uniref:GNAT family N-acetyltransferase n=1 Tax=Micromonospora musae TaxID=1894970 RepID=UPI00341B3F1C